MNNLFFGILCTFLGAAIGGAVTISTPQAQKNITNILFATTGGVASAWAGYGLGRWQTKGEQRQGGITSSTSSQSTQPSSETSDLPKFKIAYPHQDVKHKETVKGSFENLKSDYEEGVWLYVLDDAPLYKFHRVREIDRVLSQWKIENIPFGQPASQDDGKTYDIQVIWANSNVRSELIASKGIGLRQLPTGIKVISEKITVKRKVFF